MSVQLGNLWKRGYVPLALSFVYTSTGCKTKIDKFTITNTDTNAQSFSIYITPNNGVGVTDTYRLVYTKSLNPDETWLGAEIMNVLLMSGNAIAMSCSAGSTLCVSSCGRFIT